MPDRQSQEFRLAHLPDGERVFVPLTDPPTAPEPDVVASPPDSPAASPSPPRGWSVWLPLLVAAMSGGGVATSIVERALDGYDMREALERHESAQAERDRELQRALTDHAVQIELARRAEEEARKRRVATNQQVRSLLRQPTGADVEGALMVLTE